MSKHFNQNSRFQILSEENKKKSEENKKKSEENKKKLEENKKKSEENKKKMEENKKKSFIDRQVVKDTFFKEDDIEKRLSIENFPQLTTLEKISKNNNSYTNIPSFLEKIKKEINYENENKSKEQLDFEELKPGWTLIKMDKNKITMKQKKILNFENEKPIINEKDINYNVFESLANLHENWKQEYIDNWGEDEYNKMFVFSDYDYHYFDKLDEKYEKEILNYYNQETDY